MGVRGVCAGVLAALAMALPATASAATCTITWNGSTNGDWREEARWSPQRLPNVNDVACIAAGSVVHAEESHVVGSVQVTASGALLVSGGVLSLTSGTNRSELGDEFDPAVTVTTGGELRIGAAGATARALLVDGGTLRVDPGSGLDVAELLDLGGGLVTGGGVVSVGSEGVVKTGLGPTALVDVATLQTDLLVADQGTLAIGSAWNGLNGGTLTGVLSVSAGGTIALPSAISTVALGGAVDFDGGAITVGQGATGAFAGPLNVAGDLTVFSGVLTVGSLTLDGGVLSLVDDGGLAASTGVLVGPGGVARGDENGTPTIVSATPVRVAPQGRLEGSIRVTPGIALEGGTWAPYGSGLPVPLAGNAVLDGTYEIGVDLLASTMDQTEVTGNVQLGAVSFVRPNGAPGFPPLGTVWTPLTYGSATGALGTVTGALLLDAPRPPSEPPPEPPRALMPVVEAGALRVRVVPAAQPTADATAVTVGADRRLSVAATVHPGGLSTRVTLEYGPTATYGVQAALPTVAPAITPVATAGQASEVLAPGTYHARLVVTNDLGTARSGDIVVDVPADPVVPPPPPTVPTPTTPAVPAVPEPVTPFTPTVLTPLAAPGARTLAVTALRFGALRVPFSYRLTAPCATPCRARVELRVRSGKQRFDVRLAGDGKVLATRRNVVLKRGVNALRVDISKAALRGVTWTPAGRFRTLRARLRVVLPQADGRELVTVRDVTLRAPRP